MYAILTSKPGQYHARIAEGAHIVESYEYRFYGRQKALFDVVRLDQETRVSITEETAPYICNSVPTKFLEKFDTVEQARASLQQLIGFGQLDATLQPYTAAAAVDEKT